MCHDICCRNNPTSKYECDRKMLAELNALVPMGRCEKVDRQLVRSVIGLKHRLGLGVHWSNQLANELHKPVRRRFDKRTVFSKQVDDIWTVDLPDMSPCLQIEQGLQKFLDGNRCIQQVLLDCATEKPSGCTGVSENVLCWSS